ncbi:MAG: 5'-methylthioadenosine/adenosylhomocysteine nucleosidase [Ectobacillus sp.]
MKRTWIVIFFLAISVFPSCYAAAEEPQKAIGIIGPMEEEIMYLLQKMQVHETRKIAGMKFYKGSLHGKEIVIVSSGIGKVNAAACAQALIDHYKVTAIINSGIAATLTGKYKSGDIIISADVVQHDVDASGIGEEPGTIARMNIKYFQADKKLIQAAKQAGEKIENYGVYVGHIASGDQFVENHDFKARIRRQFAADAVEMEGAAIGHVAYLNRVPFVVIRAIADDATGVEEAAYNKLIHFAARQASLLTEEMLKNKKLNRKEG